VFLFKTGIAVLNGVFQVVCVTVNAAVGSVKPDPPVLSAGIVVPSAGIVVPSAGIVISDPTEGIVISDPTEGIVIPNPSRCDVAANAIDVAEIMIATTKAIGNSIPLFFI